MKLLMAGRTRYPMPLTESLSRKFDTLADEVEISVLGTRGDVTGDIDPRFTLVAPIGPRFLEGALFYLRFPRQVARALTAASPRRDPGAGCARERPRAPGAEAGARAGAGDRRRPRRPGGGDEALRLARPATPRAAGRPARALGAQARRRGADHLGVHDPSGARDRRRAVGRVSRVHGSRPVRRYAARAVAGPAGRALRRCARALQGAGHPRRGMAARRRSDSRRPAAARRARDAHARSRGASSPRSPTV